MADVGPLRAWLLEVALSVPRSDQEAERSVQAVLVDLVDHLNVALLLQLAKFLSLQPHQGRTLVAIEVDELRVAHVCDLG